MTVISPPPTRQNFNDPNGGLDREWDKHFQDMWKRSPKQSVTDTGSIPAGTRQDILVSWKPAFQDLNFSLSATIEDTSPAGAGLRIERIRLKNAANATIQVINDAAGDLSGKIHVTVVHD